MPKAVLVGKKVKARSSRRRLPKTAEAALRRSMLALHAGSLAAPSTLGNAARIVQALTSHFGLVLPRWRDLTPVERLNLCQLAGKDAGLNQAFTFNISDEQRESWIETYGDLAEGFRRVVIKGMRHIFPTGVLLWFVVEPKEAVGARAERYCDLPGRPRRFDVHGAIHATEEQLSRLQRSIWARAFKLKPADPSDPYPLQKFGRSALMRPIRDDWWIHYPLKGLLRTIRLHSDVVGDKPFGASQKLHADAKARYEDFRGLVVGAPPLPAQVQADISVAVEAVHHDVPAGRVVERLKRAEVVIRLTIVNHYLVEAPPLALPESPIALPESPTVSTVSSAEGLPPVLPSSSLGLHRPSIGRRTGRRSAGLGAVDDNPLLRPVGDQHPSLRLDRGHTEAGESRGSRVAISVPLPASAPAPAGTLAATPEDSSASLQRRLEEMLADDALADFPSGLDQSLPCAAGES